MLTKTAQSTSTEDYTSTYITSQPKKNRIECPGDVIFKQNKDE